MVGGCGLDLTGAGQGPLCVAVNVEMDGSSLLGPYAVSTEIWLPTIVIIFRIEGTQEIFFDCLLLKLNAL